MTIQNCYIDHDRNTLPCRPKEHESSASMSPAPISGVFNSPNRNGPKNCSDIQSRNGQIFELVAEIWDVDLTDSMPMALIRFPDGVEIEAYEEEIGWGECHVGGARWC